ncbi:DNA-binding protein [Monaibacterium marinum]|uniref:DNA-binding protein n=1 Tax=Pontivivens marinum TaxID=1690039 RepID=A0A2C9CVS7_9RHOB|nr:HU family DNA-binding protein [Monaibacterium marinum]SOH95377.1 DNA-binding protein [Monaibacterium marinum]
MTDSDEVHDATADETTVDVGLPMLRKREIVAHVADQTGQSKADVRRTLDSALGFMRQGLLDGNELHYPTLGKVKIKYPNREGAKPMFRVIPAKETSEAFQDDSSED